MAEYITKEQAIKIIEQRQKELCPIGRYGRNYVYGSDREKYDAWEEIIDEIENMDAAEVAEVRYGKWDASDRYKFLDGSTCIRCTECGAALHLDEYQKYNWHYCPNCGARMDEEDEHEAG